MPLDSIIIIIEGVQDDVPSRPVIALIALIALLSRLWSSQAGDEGIQRVCMWHALYDAVYHSVYDLPGSTPGGVRACNTRPQPLL
jgi:hypothetical protein